MGGIFLKAEELCRILIVDDEQLIRKGIIHYIDWEQEGFIVAGEASNGREALELIEVVHPQIIITDIVMPIMDGEELTRVVKERYPHIEIIILSSFSEYDYVRSSFQNGVVDYILKPKLDAESLLNGLKKAASRIPALKASNQNSDGHPPIEQIMNNLISGYEVTWSEHETTTIFPFQSFYLLGVSGKSETTDLQTIVKERIVEKLRENVVDGVYYSCSPNKNMSILLINIEKVNIENVIKAVTQFLVLEPNIRFSLTDEFSDFLQMGNVYKDKLSKLLNYQFFLSEMPLLMSGNLPEPPSLKEPFHLDLFTKEIKDKQFDSAFGYLKEYAAQFSQCYTVDPFEYKAFYSKVIFNIIILLSNTEYDVRELDTAKYSYFKSIDEVATAQEAVAILDSFIEEVKKYLSPAPELQDHFNMKKLINFMMEHYAEPLTLTETAKHFHFNPSYLSNYFSTHMHEGFIEYLNKIRIEEASKLLIKDTIPISEISEMVGYSDHSYFCKVFKKVKGLSPSQFKRKTVLK
jgi:two-component system, response regulator YesN